MTLIDIVTRLKELDKAAEPKWTRGDCGSIYCEKSPTKYPLMTPYGINANAPEIELAVALRNAAPALLEVLGAFQGGDAIKLGFAADILGMSRDDDIRSVLEVLRRLAAAARKMEAKQE